MRLVEEPLSAPLPQLMAQPPGQALRLFWLGQAGFIVEGAGKRLVIDPYLSDSLAEKYRGTAFPHTRMMEAPIAPEQIRHVDLVMSTHAHTDHMDPGTLPALLAANPAAFLIAPRAAREVALARSGIAPERLAPVEAGESLTVAGIQITATRAAHETLERDAEGNHRFLGFAMRLAGTTIFHSGDTIPFEGQLAEVMALNADLALLPVNGRDALRAARGVPGNLTLPEALTLTRNAGIPAMIAHHFDLFSFNTAPRHEVEQLTRASLSPLALAARTDLAYGLVQEPAGIAP